MSVERRPAHSPTVILRQVSNASCAPLEAGLRLPSSLALPPGGSTPLSVRGTRALSPRSGQSIRPIPIERSSCPNLHTPVARQRQLTPLKLTSEQCSRPNTLQLHSSRTSRVQSDSAPAKNEFQRSSSEDVHVLVLKDEGSFSCNSVSLDDKSQNMQLLMGPPKRQPERSSSPRLRLSSGRRVQVQIDPAPTNTKDQRSSPEGVHALHDNRFQNEGSANRDVVSVGDTSHLAQQVQDLQHALVTQRTTSCNLEKQINELVGKNERQQAEQTSFLATLRDEIIGLQQQLISLHEAQTPRDTVSRDVGKSHEELWATQQFAVAQLSNLDDEMKKLRLDVDERLGQQDLQFKSWHSEVFPRFVQCIEESLSRHASLIKAVVAGVDGIKKSLGVTEEHSNGTAPRVRPPMQPELVAKEFQSVLADSAFMTSTAPNDVVAQSGVIKKQALSRSTSVRSAATTARSMVAYINAKDSSSTYMDYQLG